ncbi:hypothetical protein LTR87_006777 [Friedmanniomyces endolithicus]|nr:hypothetical protein LTR03_006417 [Friedmanniomyces endolithicus]KAK0879395.1 hypothetical protein LTR87_006777 [Friedmanniomyces endolithicus]
MADIFYFRSPRRPNSTPRRSPVTRSKASITKRKRPGSMETFNPHACMARFDEPTFCPSNVSAILATYSLPLAGPTTSGPLSVPELLDDDEDVEDEAGGVPLTPQQANGYGSRATTTDHHPDATLDTTDYPVESSLSAGSPPASGFSAFGSTPRRFARGDFSNDDTEQQAQPMSHRIFTMPAPVAPRSVLGSSHPRPVSQELWDEEDGRRLRFALEGFDISEVPRFMIPDALGISSERDGTEQGSMQTHQSSSASFHDTQTGRLDGSVMMGVPHSAQQPQHSLLSGNDSQSTHSSQQDMDLIARSTGATSMLMRFDDDGLAVDDPRRNYDFAEFMDDWRLRSAVDSRVTLFKEGKQPTMDTWRPPDHLSRDMVGPQLLDMQGLGWDTIGPERKDALAARVELCRHTSSNHPPASKSDAVPQRTLESEEVYRFRSFTPRHLGRTPHYQLRNALAATSRSDVFYSSGSKVLRTSLAYPASQDTVMDFVKLTSLSAGFRITCLAASPSLTGSSNSLLLAGGFNGEYALLNLDQENGPGLREGFVTHAYNGLVTHIHTFAARRTGTPQAALCSNDRRLRLLDTNTARFTADFTYPHAINCSTTSPDGRLRVLVGDSRDAYITDAERGDNLVKLRGHLDHGFACAWSTSGVHVATGAQDGHSLIWDARNWSQPLHSLSSIMSCPRSLHFTDAGALVVAESDDVVSVYDAGTFHKRQDIRFFGSIVGVALLDGGAELAVANTDETVGGLLTFQRTAQGLNGGTFGARMPGREGAGRGARRARGPAVGSRVYV